MEEKKNAGDLRRDALLYRPKNGWDRITAAQEAELKGYCEDYKKFLDDSMTEREAVETAIALAEAKGFKPFVRGMELKAGDKIYRSNRGKAIMLAVVGTESLDQGANICAAHIDSPRLDLKPNPLYEDAELAFLKTHYYGGIRKYQWVTIPLELHGVVALKDGSTVKVVVGPAAGDPIFTIDDLLPHLGGEQSKKPLGEAIPGESLNVLIGSRPFAGDEGSWRRTSSPPSWRWSPPSVPPTWVLTAPSSAPTATTTGCAAMPPWPACWTWRRSPPRPPCACWPTRRRSAPRASAACSPPPLIPSCPTCATARRWP